MWTRTPPGGAVVLATGIVLLLQPGAMSWSVGLRVGYRREDDAESAYAGIELGRGF